MDPLIGRQQQGGKKVPQKGGLIPKGNPQNSGGNNHSNLTMGLDLTPKKVFE